MDLVDTVGIPNWP